MDYSRKSRDQQGCLSKEPSHYEKVGVERLSSSSLDHQARLTGQWGANGKSMISSSLSPMKRSRPSKRQTEVDLPLESVTQQPSFQALLNHGHEWQQVVSRQLATNDEIDAVYKPAAVSLNNNGIKQQINSSTNNGNPLIALGGQRITSDLSNHQSKKRVIINPNPIVLQSSGISQNNSGILSVRASDNNNGMIVRRKAAIGAGPGASVGPATVRSLK